MGVFRTSVDPATLRDTLTDEQIARHETTYQASRGGHFPAEEKPLPGAPLEGPRAS